jgi:cytoskeletal protein CcmA (bactofilin family)
MATQNKDLNQPVFNTLAWNVPLDDNFGYIDEALGGVYTVSSSGGTVAITKAQARNSRVSITGSLTSNLIVTIPINTGGTWIVTNSTTDGVGGPWTVTFKVAGAAVNNVVPRNYTDIYFSTGTSVVTGEIYSATALRLSVLGGTVAGNLIVDQGTLTVNNVGTANALQVTGGNVTIGGNGTTTGNLTAQGNVTAFSDARLKEDVREITDAVKKLQSIRGVTYRMRDARERRAGVIAQEVQKVLPEVVFEHDDGYLHVAYGNMVSILISAVKELAKRVEELEQR